MKTLACFVLIFTLLVPAVAFATYDDAYLLKTTSLTQSNPLLETVIDEDAIVEYTLAFEAQVAADKAAGITPWYEDEEWQQTCATIESWSSHELPQTAEEWDEWYEAGVFSVVATESAE